MGLRRFMDFVSGFGGWNSWAAGGQDLGLGGLRENWNLIKVMLLFFGLAAQL